MNTHYKSGDEVHESSFLRRYFFVFFFIFFEACLIVFWAVGIRFGDNIAYAGPTVEAQEANKEHIQTYYPVFQDVHVMVYVGFGFLMVFLKSHKWSAVSFNWLIACLAFQCGVPLLHFWEMCMQKVDPWHKLDITIPYLIRGDFVSATILISMGAALGKLNMTQLCFMAMAESVTATCNSVLGEMVYHAIDMGGSMYIHTFGAYFGLSMIMVMKNNHKEAFEHPKNSASYISNSFSMMGTIFLFLYWPSFNGALCSGAGQTRAIVNTTLGLSSCVISVFLVSIFYHKGFLNMETVLNSTISGAVMLGGTSDLFESPYIAMIIGCWAGILSSAGVAFLEHNLQKWIGLYDTCGINNLHGMPGIFGGFLTAIAVGVLKDGELHDMVHTYFHLSKTHRSPSRQAGFQLAALATTLAISIISGLLTGLILNLSFFNPPAKFFDDSHFWEGFDEEKYALHKLPDAPQTHHEEGNAETNQQPENNQPTEKQNLEMENKESPNKNGNKESPTPNRKKLNKKSTIDYQEEGLNVNEEHHK